MKTHHLSTTDNYHKHELDSLVWEVTLPVMLEDQQSLCRGILRKPDSFGNLLFDFLARVIPMGRIRRILEIGGGYGYLMRDFLKRNNTLCATMIDLSPYLLARQRETLRDFPVEFLQGDFFDVDESILLNVDLAILNEVVGDFPAACDIPGDILLQDQSPEDSLLLEVLRTCKSFGISPPPKGRFTMNLGAIKALEKMCSARIPYIYISEHSCEARVPERMSGLMDLASSGVPERIRLHGHDEYSIRFSDLEKVAKTLGYRSRRGQYLDFIDPVIEGEVEFILRLGASKIDRHEIIGQFIGDLVKYEYLILSLH